MIPGRANAVAVVSDFHTTDGGWTPFSRVTLRCGHMTLWRRSLVRFVYFGQLMKCIECGQRRDV